MKQAALEEKKAIIEKVRTFFKKRAEIIFAYLYGSFSEGWPFKDVDIGVYVNEEKIPKDEALEYELRISAQGEIETRVIPLDVRVINYAPVGLKYHITKGILLFSRNEELRCDFLENTWRKYFDLLPKRKQILLDLLSP